MKNRMIFLLMMSSPFNIYLVQYKSSCNYVVFYTNDIHVDIQDNPVYNSMSYDQAMWEVNKLLKRYNKSSYINMRIDYYSKNEYEILEQTRIQIPEPEPEQTIVSEPKPTKDQGKNTKAYDDMMYHRRGNEVKELMQTSAFGSDESYIDLQSMRMKSILSFDIICNTKKLHVKFTYIISPFYPPVIELDPFPDEMKSVIDTIYSEYSPAFTFSSMALEIQYKWYDFTKSLLEKEELDNAIRIVRNRLHRFL